MQNKFLDSDHFELWTRKNLFFVFSILFYSQVLHVLLLLLGFKKLKYFLDIACIRKKSEYVMNELEAKYFREKIRLLFRKIRGSKMFFCNCFSSSLALWYMLKCQGLETQLRIGTRKLNHEFKAHSWVEIDKIPLNGSLNIREKYKTFNHDFSNQINNFH